MNEHADVKWNAGEFVVVTHHGSGSGRSYGYAEIIQSPATEPGWANNSQTETWQIAPTMAEAETIVEIENGYYDGSDYH